MAFNFKMPYEKKVLPQRELGIYIHIPFCRSKCQYCDFYIIAALWLEPVCNRLKVRCHIKEDSFAWRAFITLRTFFLVTLIKVFPEVGSFGDGVGFWAHCFKNWDLGGVGGRMLYPVELPRQLALLYPSMIALIFIIIYQKKAKRNTRFAFACHVFSSFTVPIRWPRCTGVSRP